MLPMLDCVLIDRGGGSRRRACRGGGAGRRSAGRGRDRHQRLFAIVFNMQS
eukprot:CAMPEP_0179074346 /NCGR_PEP_ID=MMETSP0796-20121207/33040_1 /TAXON_ID=73915 /ORGANISM="Pyrodinium bahamense, Strain pbaha01" /LENGTH=50 /DNA_ID=CAMNT_0020771569 /DNA_START=86 /DNA_END=235 /DNA_ORIENTATION=-